MGYATAPGDAYDRLFTALLQIQRRLSELERPDGTQTAEALQQIRDIIDGIIGATNISVPGNISAGVQVSSPNLIGTNVYTTNGPTTVHTGPRVAAWLLNAGGLVGTASSRRFKDNIVPAGIDPAAVLSIGVKEYQYKAELAKRAADPNYHVATEVGMIAEDLHRAGLWQFVIYEYEPDPDFPPVYSEPEIADDGTVIKEAELVDPGRTRTKLDARGKAIPFSIHYELFALALLPVLQDHERRLKALEG
jgi:hypothetical protein